MSKNLGGGVTQFVYDGLNPVQELDGANPPNVTANLLTGLGIDERFTRTDASGAMSFLTDALGSTIGLVNAGGSIATSYIYDPFGATTVGGTSNANSYQFTGRENDGTGLYFYRARYYSPTFQRFIAQDPLGFASGDANLYVYVSDDPADLTDPSGKAIFPPRPGDVFPTPEISCSALGGLFGGVAGVGVGVAISSFFPPSELVEPLLGGFGGRAVGLQYGDQWFGSSGLCRPSPPPNSCSVR
ncbi:MAG: RHS repeat-associated core domain-containing protein [Candidatus Binataceae bacterium]|nr:RHS repeat-associated core domain-containing protein [Candidatus Binataceae bacterium]